MDKEKNMNTSARLLRRITALVFLSLAMNVSCTGPEGDPGANGQDGTNGAGDLQLPGDRFYPESLDVAADGTLFVGSLALGEVVKFAPSGGAPTVFVAPGGDVKGVTGVMVDDSTSSVLICTVDLSGATNSVVRTYDMATGAPKASYTFPSPAFCDDMVFDAHRNLYATDAYGAVYVLRDGDTSFTLWSSDPLLAPSAQGGFGADGITFDGDGHLYVTAFSDSRFLAIPINEDGSAGTVAQLTVGGTLTYPDGMRQIDATHLLVIEGIGNLTRLTIDGDNVTTTVLNNRLDNPTAIAVHENDYWITEGQLSRFAGYDSSPTNLPFLVRHMYAQ